MSRSGPKPQVSPMLIRSKQIVDDLVNQLNPDDKESAPNLDPGIAKKYGVQKYQLKNLDNEPVEVWVFDKNSKLEVPLIEDRALRSAESIIEAAKEVFRKAKRGNQTHLLDAVMQEFRKKVDESFENETTPDDFSEHAGALDKLLKNVINDIGMLWRMGYPNVYKLDENQQKHVLENFYKELWDNTNTAKTSFKQNNLLVINKLSHSVQYHERGTRPEFVLEGESKAANTEKQYRSAHHRLGVGVSNFIAYTTGHLDNNGEVVLTDTGFRHASLPPIDIYDLKTSDNDKHADSVVDTTINLKALGREIKSRLDPNNQHNERVNLVNVSLLTVTDFFEKQGTQFRETILAKDRLLAQQQNIINPIIFDFGVNLYASEYALDIFYPDDQKFENNRAFFALHKIFQQQLEKDQPEVAKALSAASGIAKEFEEKVEQDILKFAKKYDAECVEYAKEPSLTRRNYVAKAEANLNKAKEKLYKTADDLIKKYYDTYNSTFKYSAQITDKNLFSALNDFHQIVRLFMSPGSIWNNKENTFELQAHIVDLGGCLNRLGSFASTSWNCKSNNDRSALKAYKVDLLRLQRVPQEIKPESKESLSYYHGSAFVMNTAIDSSGDPKFGGRKILNVVETDFGHPEKSLAKMQTKTAKWAVHELAKNSSEYLSPKDYKLLNQSDSADAVAEANIKDLTEYYKEMRTALFDKLDDLEVKEVVRNKLDLFFGVNLHRKVNSNDRNYDTRIYFVLDVIKDYLTFVHHENFPDNVKKACLDVVTQFVNNVQTPSDEVRMASGSKENMHAKYSVTAPEETETKKSKKDDWSVNSFANYSAAMSGSRNFLQKIKSDSSFTLAVQAAYGAFPDPLNTKAKNVDELRDQVQKLDDIKKAAQAFLTEKLGQKANPKRKAIHEAVRDFAESEINKRLEFINSAKDKFLAGEIGQADQIIRNSMPKYIALAPAPIKVQGPVYSQAALRHRFIGTNSNSPTPESSSLHAKDKDAGGDQITPPSPYRPTRSNSSDNES